MFDIGWSELLILGVVTLIFVGPKELPVFLRTIGKYVGMLKSQAAEFRAQFDAAMREAELDQLKKDVESVGRDVAGTIRDAEHQVRSEMDVAKRELDTAASMPSTPESGAGAPAAPGDPDAHDADGLPLQKAAIDAASAGKVAAPADAGADAIPSRSPAQPRV